MTIAEIIAALNAIIEGASDRELTDEEVQRYEELEGKLEAAKRHEGILQRNRSMNAVGTGLQINTNEASGGDAGGDDVLERAFEHYIRTGTENADLLELRAQNEGTASAGGYLVPEGFRNKIVDRMVAFGGLHPEAENIVTETGNTLPWPTIDDTANSAEIVAEGAAASTAGADLVFGERNLGAYKYESTGAGNAPLKVSWELLQDSAFDIQGMVAKKLGERIARKLAVDLITGTGTGQPQGIVTGAPTAIEMFADVTAPTWAEIVTFLHNLDRAYRVGAKWLMNDSSLALFEGLTDTAGRPLLQPAQDASAASGTGQRLAGYEVVVDDGMPDMGDDTTPIIFGNLSEAYVVRRVKDITVVAFNELYAATGHVGFMGWARFDACVQNPNAIILGEGQID